MPDPPNRDDPKATLAALVTRAEAGDFRGLDTIVARIAGDDAEVRIKAAYACERIGFAGAASALGRMAIRDPLAGNRSQAMYALASIGRPAVVPALTAALADDDGACRDDARAALYRVLGAEILPLLADEEMGSDPDPEERTRVTSWWRTRAGRFDPGLVYAFGVPGGPGAFIARLVAAKPWPPDALLGALHQWTGQDFGQAPRARIVAAWRRWWTANQAAYQPGRRYFFGRPVPGRGRPRPAPRKRAPIQDRPPRRRP